MSRRDLRRRLDRLEAMGAKTLSTLEVAFVNDDTPGGLRSVMGPDGSEVWWVPPEGCSVGEPLNIDERPACPVKGPIRQKMNVVFVVPDDESATTVMGPDGRLVWLRPPEEFEAGQAIEDCVPTRTPDLGRCRRYPYDHDPEPD